MKPILVFRLEVDGVEVVREEIGIDEAEAAAERHSDVATAAADEGKTWFLEITDPDGLIAPFRLSNDPNHPRIIEPVEATPERIDFEIERRRP